MYKGKQLHLLIDLQACQSLVHGTRGIGRYASSLVQAMLRQAGSRRVSFLLNGDMPDSAALLRKTLLATVDARDIHVWSGPTARAASLNGVAWRREAAAIVRESVIENIGADCVLLTSVFEGWHDDSVCMPPSHEGGAALAAVVYDLIPFLYPDLYLADPRLREWYLGTVRRLSATDMVLSISDSARLEVLEATSLTEARVLNISSAVDERYAPAAGPVDADGSVRGRIGLVRPFVMYTGGIDSRKNIERLIEAFARAGSYAASHQLAIVCSISDVDVQRLRQVGRDAGLGDGALVLTGYVADEDLLALYRLCDLFVFPSWHEGFGLPVLEAMSVGAPVAVADSSSLPEVVGDAGVRFDPHDTDAIARAISDTLADPSLLAKLREAGLERSRGFSWDRTAATAWQGVERAVSIRRQSVDVESVSGTPGALSVPGASRRRLAFLSPLPPERSGIADFSAELLQELVAHYDIELVTNDDALVPKTGGLNLPVRSVSWFLQNAQRFDRVLYQFGNSEFHGHMFDVLAQVPGTVVLHDYFLGNLSHFLQDTGRLPGFWNRALYRSHGYPALLTLGAETDRNAVAFKYPCNWQVISDADGVLVHSQYAFDLARDWFGQRAESRFLRMPLLKRRQAAVDRPAARAALGIPTGHTIVASFGVLSSIKCNEQLLEAWISAFAKRTDCTLVFVGQPANPEFASMLRARADRAGCKNVTITGFAEPEVYRHWLATADVAVQLRTQSRGETSAAVLDCFAWGLPVIVNGHGSMRELPHDTAIVLEDAFDVADLTKALADLVGDGDHRAALARRALDYLSVEHDPARIASLYREAIEEFHARSPRHILSRAVDRLTGMRSSVPPSASDWDAAAKGLVELRGAAGSHPQLLLDISELVRTDARSGIQRVVRSILSQLLRREDLTYRVEPVYTTGDGVYRYARDFAAAFLQCPSSGFPDEVIDVDGGDIFVALDLVPTGIPAATHALQWIRARGVEVVFVLYDMLPITHPEWFTPAAPAVLVPWYGAVAELADRVVSISRAVSDEFEQWLSGQSRKRSVELSWFHLGADVHASVPSSGMTPEDGERLCALAGRKVVLMVGTIEPRKGHDQALEAMRALRRAGTDARFVIVGKQGWCVESLIEQIVADQQAFPDSVVWFPAASDELLEQIYQAADVLLIASRGEGFGLPIVEGSLRGLKVLARDLPVFREVGGDGIRYFDGDSVEVLAEALRAALQAPSHLVLGSGVEVLRWEESATQFLDSVTGKHLYRRWNPDNITG